MDHNAQIDVAAATLALQPPVPSSRSLMCVLHFSESRELQMAYESDTFIFSQHLSHAGARGTYVNEDNVAAIRPKPGDGCMACPCSG